MDDYMNQSKKGVFTFNDVAHFLILLLVSKFFKSFGIYLCYDLLKQIHLVQLLFYTLLVASIFYIILQKPFSSSVSASQQSAAKSAVNATTASSNKRLNKFQYLRLFKYSLFQTFIKLLWLFGLTQCGPLRTTLIFEQSEFVVLCALKAIFLSQTNPSRSRGVIVLLIATLILFAFDYDDISNKVDSDHPEGRHHGIFSHVFYFVISWFNVADHKAGVLLLVSALFMQMAFSHSSLAKVLVTDLGGSKRLRALSTIASTIIIAPWAIFNLFTSVLDPSSYTSFGSTTADGEILAGAELAAHSWLYYLMPVVLIGLFLFVLDFYIESYVIQKTDSTYAAKYGAVFVFTCSIGLSFIWNHPHLVRVMVMDKIKTIVEEEHALSGGVIIAYFLYMLATEMLSRPLIKHKGSFIGYSAVGNPLYSLTGENLKRTSMSMVTVIKNILREIVMHTDSRRIFYFLCLNLAFTFVELFYGVISNSLGLISDGVHMLFDCSALVMGLFAAVVSQWKPTKVFSYGFGRLEILSGFINGLFLIVISIFVFIEAVMRLMEPPEIKNTKIIYVSVAGLCINLFGMFALGHAHSHGGAPCDHSHSAPSPAAPSHGHSHGAGASCNHNHSHGGGGGNSHNHSHSTAASSQQPVLEAENDNMRGVFLHVLADTLGSVGVIISSFLMQQFGWYIADPLCSMCIAVMIFGSVIPLIKHSSSLLLLRTPSNREKLFNILLQRILNIDGVVSYRDDHCWQMSSNSYAATLHVQIGLNAHEQIISAQINSILKDLKLSSLTIQIEKETFFQHLSGLGANMGQIDESKVVRRAAQQEGTGFINIEKFV